MCNVVKSLDHASSVLETYRFITFLKAEISFIKQFPPNFATDNG